MGDEVRGHAKGAKQQWKARSVAGVAGRDAEARPAGSAADPFDVTDLLRDAYFEEMKSE